jgi:threonine dehydrogenase-like Zn-dependent dehydrogenase
MFEEWGGHVARSICAANQVFPLPAGVEPERFSGAVLAQVGYNAGSRAPLNPGDVAVVLGDGLVGLWAAQTLQHRGARVWLFGRHDDRLARFVTREGDRAVRVGRNESFADMQRHFTEPATVLVETISSLRALEALAPKMRGGGHLVCTGFYGAEDALHIPLIRVRELSVHTPAGWGRRRLEQTIDLLARGVLGAREFITHRLPVREAARAYHLLAHHEENALGVLLQWENA